MPSPGKLGSQAGRPRWIGPLVPVAAGALVALAQVAAAAPYVPTDDAKVLERLPVKPADPAARELRDLRARLAAQPEDLDAAVRLARGYFHLARSEGDPRFIGYAEGALRPWPEGNGAPHEVLVVRALLRQYRHDFDGALDALAAAAVADPTDPEVPLWRAAILLVRADYAGAASACEALRGMASPLDWIACKASVYGVTGRAAPAYASLRDALARARGVRPGPKLWMLTRLAEFSLVLDEPDRAEQHFREALALRLDDQFLLAAYADFLLDRGRPAEVAALLKDWTRSDALLLRLAVAEKALKAPGLSEHTRALRARFDAAALRGDTLHQQEEARFNLHLLGQPSRALALAQANWALQREPRDARILLEAALAVNDPAAAQPALDWLSRSGYEDPRLRRLAAGIEARR